MFLNENLITERFCLHCPENWTCFQNVWMISVTFLTMVILCARKLLYLSIKKNESREKGSGGGESSSYLNELTDPGADRTTAAAWIYNAKGEVCPTWSLLTEINENLHEGKWLQSVVYIVKNGCLVIPVFVGEDYIRLVSLHNHLITKLAVNQSHWILKKPYLLPCNWTINIWPSAVQCLHLCIFLGKRTTWCHLRDDHKSKGEAKKHKVHAVHPSQENKVRCNGWPKVAWGQWEHY